LVDRASQLLLGFGGMCGQRHVDAGGDLQRSADVELAGAVVERGVADRDLGSGGLGAGGEHRVEGGDCPADARVELGGGLQPRAGQHPRLDRPRHLLGKRHGRAVQHPGLGEAHRPGAHRAPGRAQPAGEVAGERDQPVCRVHTAGGRDRDLVRGEMLLMTVVHARGRRAGDRRGQLGPNRLDMRGHRGQLPQRDAARDLTEHLSRHRGQPGQRRRPGTGRDRPIHHPIHGVAVLVRRRELRPDLFRDRLPALRDPAEPIEHTFDPKPRLRQFRCRRDDTVMNREARRGSAQRGRLR